MNTITEILTQAASVLEAAHIPNPALDAGLLLAHVLGKSRAELLISPEKTLSDTRIQAFNALAARRARHEPVAYIIGKKEFWSLDFCVTYDTLIPRPDSETLIEAALRRVQSRAKPITLLDMGTGTGCLLITLLKELPESCGVGIDNNVRTVKVARENARKHNVENRSHFICSHWCDAIDGTFDLILSNPPYISVSDARELMQDVRDYEPHGALVGGEDGLDCYRALAPQAARLLSGRGFALFEVGAGQGEAVAGLLLNEGLAIDEIVKDLSGQERCVVARKN